MMNHLKTLLSVLFILFTFSLSGQSTKAPVNQAWQSFTENKDQSSFSGLKWDLIGPVINSGRVEAIDVVPDTPGIIYAGFGTGNLWKTTNHGLSWDPIFDNHAGYSIGDVKIAPSNSDIVYVATGESLRAKRGHTIPGGGVYRSNDAGKTWNFLGLDKTHHISRITVHPTNPDIVFVAALGNFYSPSKERGVYKTENGGKTWQKVLYADDRTGGNDVIISETNPSIMYASTWECAEVKAGPGGSLYKSIDGGDTWKKSAKGFPAGEENGRIGLALSNQNSDKVYAFIDNVNAGYEDGSGELYLTKDGGKNWSKTHDKNLKILNTFGEVFTDCFVNPLNDNEVYLLGVNVLRSTDAGKSFTAVRGDVQNIHPSPSNTFHLDHHELWINPANPDHLIAGNDGGLYISYDNGSNWMHYNNIPVGEFYFVRTDNDMPYKIYSGTQDDSAVRGPAKTLKKGAVDGWEYVWIDVWGGGDGIVVTPDLETSDIVYYESQNGAMRRKVMSTGKVKNIKPRLPRNSSTKLFNEWLTPFFTSIHSPKTLYYGANFIFKTTDRGDSWDVISPDLSQSSDPVRVGNGVIATEESPTQQGLLYAGTSKGAAWVTKDDGKNWREISNGLAPKYIKSFAPSNFVESRVYITQSGITEDDLNAYVYTSEDYGKTWTSIKSNLPNAPVNVILEDPNFENVLYCGTFNGVFISEDRGATWKVLGNNMPNAFVADMTIQTREKDLIAVTHGRGIYKIDLNPLHQNFTNDSEAAELLHISEAILPSPDGSGRKPDLSTYEDVAFSFFIPSDEKIELTIMHKDGEIVFSDSIESTTGLNTYKWNLMVDFTPEEGPYLRSSFKMALEGTYSLQLKGGKTNIKRSFTIIKK